MEQHLTQYRIFYAVARAGNISRAAKELFISQPAISKSISKLEESLGMALFIRNSRGVSLTAEGQVLFQHVEAAFEALERGENELKQIQNLHIGQLKIGVSNTLCKYILLPYLKGFIAQYPHVRILIESQDTARTISMLEQQKLDIGLIAEPKNRRSLSFLPVMRIEDTFVCTRSYLENLRIREGADVDPFESGTILLLDRSNMTRTHIDAYFAEHGIEPKQILEATTMDLLIEFAKTGLGIGCVIREFVREELKDGSLIELPLEIIGNTTAISYETKNSGAWRSSCHMPDFFCLVPIFINFLLKYSSHISTHMEIFSHLPARHTLSNKFLLKCSSEPDSPRSPASLPPQNKCCKTNRKSWQSQASVSGRFPCYTRRSTE